MTTETSASLSMFGVGSDLASEEENPFDETIPNKEVEPASEEEMIVFESPNFASSIIQELSFWFQGFQETTTKEPTPPQTNRSLPPNTMPTNDEKPESTSTVTETSTDTFFDCGVKHQSTMSESFDSDDDEDDIFRDQFAFDETGKARKKRGRLSIYIGIGIICFVLIISRIIVRVSSNTSKNNALSGDEDQLGTDDSQNSFSNENDPSTKPSRPTPSGKHTLKPIGCPTPSPSSLLSNSAAIAASPTQDHGSFFESDYTNSPSSSSHARTPASRPSARRNKRSHDYGCPSEEPTIPPTATTQPTLRPATFVPGNLTHVEVGLLLSEGLHARIIAESGKRVEYLYGIDSDVKFHGRPDFGATFPDTRIGNPGGWVYTSNSEMEQEGKGGVGAFTFDKDGNVLNYKMVLEDTTMNCGGGRTPWNTWVSCEEVEDTGLIYQVDPFGERQPEPTTIGMEKGRWESFTYDIRDRDVPRFFASEDHNKGTVRRFTPDTASWETPWEMLHGEGIVDYLIVYPNENRTGGTFNWTNDREAARNNARSYYPQSEGIDVYGDEMYLVCKRIQQIFTFNLDTMTYFNQTTVSGLFDGNPDQMQRIVGNSDDLLFFTEEGGKDAGIHARDGEGRFYTILESPEYSDETTGLAFSPNGEHMYVAYQNAGLLFDVWREDGLPFHARTLNVKYHKVGQL